MAEPQTSSGKQLRCMVVTPEATVLDEHADFVAVPMYDGEYGVAADHTPVVGRLGYGELRIRRGASTRQYYVEGGFVEVVDNVVSVLTEKAIPAQELDAAVIDERLQTALRRPAHSPEAMESRDRAVAQARAQLRLARKAK